MGDAIELPVFDIELKPGADKGSGFHTQNDPDSPFQRENVIERQGVVDIRCSFDHIIHGLFAPDSDVFCTLLVLNFRFDPRKRARRIAHANIKLQFAGSAPGAAQPEVYAIAPNGRFSFSQTTQIETTKIEGDVHVGGGVPGFDAGGALKFRHSVAREMNYATTVVGSIELRDRNYGKSNCAHWTLIENPETKTGVPIAMKTAILLKRKDEGNFQCMVSIDAKADWRTSLELLFGSTKPDDPVLLDPTIDPTSDKYNDMRLKLGELDLESISDITFTNIVEGVVKTRKIGGGLSNTG